MAERFDKILYSIYGWEINENGKIDPPEPLLPECIKERIRYFQPQMEEGLTLGGCMEYILARKSNEEDVKKDYEYCATIEWLPVSEETEEWHNSPDALLAGTRVALALIYGYDSEIYQVKYGDYYFNNCYLLTRDPAHYTHFSKEGAEKAAKLLKPRYFVKDVRFWDLHRALISCEDITPDTKIPEKYNSNDYVFLFKVGQQDVGMNAKELAPRQPECFHFDDAIKVLKSIKNIKPQVIKASKEQDNGGFNKA